MAASSTTDQPNIKYDWYQTDTYVTITVLVKNMKQDDVKIEFAEKDLKINLKLSEKDHDINLNLAQDIVPDRCSYKIWSTKIEVKLIKKYSTLWTDLERPIVCKVVVPETEKCGGPPKYPTSNPSHKDWNAIEKEISKELDQEKRTAEDGVNELFQKIYGEGSDEVKRAMNKSFVESGGTVLSTNWNEISKKKVAVNPPNGMEWKKWQ